MGRSQSLKTKKDGAASTAPVQFPVLPLAPRHQRLAVKFIANAVQDGVEAPLIVAALAAVVLAV